ncbi:MAG: ankyrin repeat domain-containing protein [Pseudomonadales bacterium]|nr:ankyrin repeat domain-containing protein [Pseudomonadales bacterium]
MKSLAMIFLLVEVLLVLMLLAGVYFATQPMKPDWLLSITNFAQQNLTFSRVDFLTFERILYVCFFMPLLLFCCQQTGDKLAGFFWHKKYTRLTAANRYIKDILVYRTSFVLLLANLYLSILLFGCFLLGWLVNVIWLAEPLIDEQIVAGQMAGQILGAQLASTPLENVRLLALVNICAAFAVNCVCHAYIFNQQPYMHNLYISYSYAISSPLLSCAKQAGYLLLLSVLAMQSFVSAPIICVILFFGLVMRWRHQPAYMGSILRLVALLCPLYGLLMILLVSVLEVALAAVSGFRASQVQVSLFELGACSVLAGILPIWLLYRYVYIPQCAELLNTAEGVETDKNAILMHAVEQGYDLTIMTCCDLGADLTQLDKTRDPLINIASKNDRISTVEILTRLGCDVTATNKLGLTALHIAASKINLRLLKILIAAGADVNCKDMHGKTPLHRLCSHIETHIADQNRYFSAIQLLLKSGSNPEQKDKRGKTAYTLAADSGQQALLDFMRSLSVERGLSNEIV